MNTATPPAKQKIHSDDFIINNLDDELRADQLCQKLLKNFHRHLLECGEYNSLEAGAMAGGGDYFLRDFVIDTLRVSIFSLSARQVRGFAGNWYIHRTLEPNMKELEVILKGVAAFYRYCGDNEWVEKSIGDEIAAVCADHTYFSERINSFHALRGDDYPGWCEECPLV